MVLASSFNVAISYSNMAIIVPTSFQYTTRGVPNVKIRMFIMNSMTSLIRSLFGNAKTQIVKALIFFPALLVEIVNSFVP